MSQATTKAIADQAITDPKLTDTGVQAGTYVGNLSVTVNAKGRVTAITPAAPLAVTASDTQTAPTTLGILMQATPPAGTYAVRFSGAFMLTGTNVQGSVAVYKNGVRSEHSLRPIAANVSTLSVLGVNISAGSATFGIPADTQDWLTCNGMDVVSVRWVSTSGLGSTLTCTGRSLVLIRVA